MDFELNFVSYQLGTLVLKIYVYQNYALKISQTTEIFNRKKTDRVKMFKRSSSLVLNRTKKKIYIYIFLLLLQSYSPIGAILFWQIPD